MKYSKYSLVVIGSGIAGLYAAIKAAEKVNAPDGILVVTKSYLNESNSRYAQGGIVGVLKENTIDSVSLHVSDTIKAGAGLSDFNVCKHVSEKSAMVIKDLIKCGVDFDKDADNRLKFTLEGAHSAKRILHCNGDATGKYIEKALVERVLNNPDITVMEQTLAVELLVDGNERCRGIVTYNDTTKEYETVYSQAVVLATGGLGQVYRHTTNPKVATGDGLAIAYRAGALVQDLEFVQFHPTALIFEEDQNRFLISEALRGEGAKLCHLDRTRFMHKYSEQKELSSRDIVTRAIFAEMKETGYTNVYLDASHIPENELKKRFPNISNICMSKGIDITKDLIPVSPAAHYTMGGIKTDTTGKTSIEGLYAIGEAGCTGLHGANRLASNSLLECAVAAYELSEHLSTLNLEVSEAIDNKIIETTNCYKDSSEPENQEERTPEDIDKLKYKLQNTMWDCVGVERNEKTLLKAKSELEEIEKEFGQTGKLNTRAEYELRNLIINANLITDFALERKESRGAHYRTDYNHQEPQAVHQYRKKGKKEYDKIFA